jgi:hypothetical protein
MARIEIDIESSASSERVIAGLTDFTERRPELWPGLSRKKYRVFEGGDTWADVQEGNNDMIWARERDGGSGGGPCACDATLLPPTVSPVRCP